MSTRSERVTDLYLDPLVGDPTEDGQVRHRGGDIVARVGGVVKSLTAGAGGGISEAQHEALDTLVHEIAEDSYEKVTRTAGQVTNVTVWTDSGMTTKIRETQITYTSGQVSQVVEIQYDGAGAAIVGQTITRTYARVSGQIDNITAVES